MLHIDYRFLPLFRYFAADDTAAIATAVDFSLMLPYAMLIADAAIIFAIMIRHIRCYAIYAITC